MFPRNVLVTEYTATREAIIFPEESYLFNVSWNWLTKYTNVPN